VVRTTNVVEDARESAPQKPNRQGLGWLAAGLLVGAGIAVLVLGVESTPEPSATTIAAEAPVTTTVAEGVGLGEVIPGFPDGLVATQREEGVSLDLVVWPEAGAPAVRSVPVGSSSPPATVMFDAGGQEMATLLPLRGSPDGILYAGVPETATIISLEVTGYAWHDSVSRSLAYTTQEGSETVIWITTGALNESSVTARAVGVGGGIRTWGDWGFAVQDGSDVVLFTPEGEIKDITPGRAFDSAPNGWLAIEDDRLQLVSAGGGIRELRGPDEDPPPVLAASFSPDGSRLAVLTSAGLAVIAADSGNELTAVEGRPGVATIAWTTDGRFALYPGQRGVTVARVDDGATWTIMESEVITGLGVLDFGQP
jgi:hypothetical protein